MQQRSIVSTPRQKSYTDGRIFLMYHHRAAAVKIGSYHAYRLWEEAAGTPPLHFKETHISLAHLQDIRSCLSATATSLVHRSISFFLQLYRAQQQHHSRTHNYDYLIFSIDDRTFQRVRREEAVIIITIISAALIRPNANRRIEEPASEGVRDPNLSIYPYLTYLFPSLHHTLSTCHGRVTAERDPAKQTVMPTERVHQDHRAHTSTSTSDSVLSATQL
jgi:hypothetical protein